MKTIGLIGGMSWESTASYYQAINQGIKQRLGGLHSAKLVLVSVDFAEIENLQTSGRWQQAGQILAQAAVNLQSAGADFLLICTNTMHKVADQVQQAVHIPLLHIADATAQVLYENGISKVGLLGTSFTMEQNFYRERLATAHGVEILLPDADSRKVVHDIIYSELCLGVIREESRQHYQTVISTLADQGAQAVVLGCTEIALLITPNDVELPLFDTTQIHVDHAVNCALTKY